jgi:hypothetical protein
MKYFGRVGYGKSSETQPGTWSDIVTERQYYGDVVKDTRRLVASQEVNANLSLGDSIEIVADPYALENFHAIKYAELAGALWEVTEIDQKRPRLILRLGGVYNGPRPTADAATEPGTTGATTAPPGRDSGR